MNTIVTPPNALTQAVSKARLSLVDDSDCLPVENAAEVPLVSQYDHDIIKRFDAKPLSLGFMTATRVFANGKRRATLPVFAAVNPLSASNTLRSQDRDSGSRISMGGLQFVSQCDMEFEVPEGIVAIWGIVAGIVSTIPIGVLGVFHCMNLLLGTAIVAVAVFLGIFFGRHCVGPINRDFTVPVNFKPGRVPAEVRALVRQAKGAFDSLHFVFEADSSTYNLGAAKVIDYDPILVGMKGGRAYLLATFDLTPLERSVSTEFRTD